MTAALPLPAADEATLRGALRVLGAAPSAVELEVVARALSAGSGALASVLRAAAGGRGAAREWVLAVGDRAGLGLTMLDVLVAVGARERGG